MLFVAEGELLENYEQLKQAGIQLRSISEGIDFSSKYGEAMLGMLAVVAQLERDIIRETLLENRVARGKRGIPTSGRLPYAHIYNKETGKWTLDEDKAKVIRQIADEYLKGESLFDIASRYQMSYNSLVKILSKRSGDEWTVSFKDEPKITFKIPHILSDDVIQHIKDRLEFNRRSNRTDIVNKYLLSGFIRCDQCKAMISGQTFPRTKKKDYRYYHHRGNTSCKAFSRVDAETIENAVFHTIFENIGDMPNFEKAIASSLPDEKMIDNLKAKIKDEKRI